MGRPQKCAKAELWCAAVSFIMDGAHSGGAPTCLAMAATAWAIAVRSGPMPGWSTGGCRPPSGAGWCHHRLYPFCVLSWGVCTRPWWLEMAVLRASAASRWRVRV